jgi:putative Holliday junction resolvase
VTVIAFDFGLKRIGVALGTALLGQARPLTTLHGEANEARFAAIDKLFAEWQPVQLVVGVPYSVEGEAHEMTARCERFARQLEARYKLSVALVDERYSSAEAERGLAAKGQNWQKRKETLDAEAAAVILQSYFDGLS